MPTVVIWVQLFIKHPVPDWVMPSFVTFLISRHSDSDSVTRNEGIQVKLEHESEYLDQVKCFKFLGSYKSADGDCTNEIKRL